MSKNRLITEGNTIKNCGYTNENNAPKPPAPPMPQTHKGILIASKELTEMQKALNTLIDGCKGTGPKCGLCSISHNCISLDDQITDNGDSVEFNRLVKYE